MDAPTSDLVFVAEDDCCATALDNALSSARPPKDKWTHAKCGCEWRVGPGPDGCLLWHPVTYVEIVR